MRDAVAAGLAHYDRVAGEYILPVPGEIQTAESFDRPED
jgi:hypothetical protein